MGAEPATPEYPTSTRSSQVVQGVIDTLKAHLDEYIDTTALPDSHYHAQGGAAILRAAMLPAICVDDQGEKKLWESIRGKNADGTVAPGCCEREYRLDVQVFTKGIGAEDQRDEINRWRDGISACLEDNWSLNMGATQAACNSSDPAFSTDLGGTMIWAGVVSVTATVFSQQGSTTVLNT